MPLGITAFIKQRLYSYRWFVNVRLLTVPTEHFRWSLMQRDPVLAGASPITGSSRKGQAKSEPKLPLCWSGTSFAGWNFKPKNNLLGHLDKT